MSIRHCLLAAVLCLASSQAAFGQRASPVARDSANAKPDSAAKKLPSWRFVHRNELETPFMTIRFGAAVLFEQDWYSQDQASKEQVGVIREGPPPTIDPPDRPHTGAPSLRPGVNAERSKAAAAEPSELDPAFKFRDTRFTLGGRIKTKRPITWQTGVMWDGTTREWFIRQTGFVIAVPEISGHLWVGRSKEGISLNRVMVGYDGWTMERFTFSDASIPLLADGIRWMGYAPKQHLIWNLGVFADALSKGQTFSYYQHQVAGRIAYLSMNEDTTRLLHAGIALKLGRPTNDTLQLKSKPEATTAPNFIDTGKFHSDLSGLAGVEAYYQSGTLLVGGEYYVQPARSDEAGDPVFHGGDVFTSWLVGGKRPYTTVGGVFRAVAPTNPLFEGGWGALELLLRLSYIDLDAGTLTGGKFWRITPSMNWYLNRNLRIEFGYGYGVLDRFDMTGGTHFFQARLQSQL